MNQTKEIRDGFCFTAIDYPFTKRDAITIYGGDNVLWEYQLMNKEILENPRTLEEYKTYIQEKGIEKAKIFLPHLEILKYCPSLKHLHIFPSEDVPDFDFSVLYERPEIKALFCRNNYGSREQYYSNIDFSKIGGLVDLGVDAHKASLNFNRVETLKSLFIGGFKGKNYDLTDAFCSKELDTLRILQCGIYSLEGIDMSDKMQCVYLEYNSKLQDISALKKVRNTLKALHIENCPKITDFSVLRELENLECLSIMGKNILPDLSFIKELKNLKTFTFDVFIKDGNLEPCLTLQYAAAITNRRGYNLKDNDLPKGKYVAGNEDIEIWRRLG